MKKRILATCVSFVVLVALIVVLLPGCIPTGRGYIVVGATLCGEPWMGALNFALTGANSTMTETAVPYSFNVDPGTWTCAYISGGPADAYLESITPSATQTVGPDDLITFTLNFEKDQDAWIEFATWTINGVPIEEWEGSWFYEPGYGYYAEVTWCDVIDVRYTQGVNGCEDYPVTLNETDELKVHYAAGEGDPIPEFVPVTVYNDLCAVNKTAWPQGEAAEKLSQVPSYEGGPVPQGELYPLPWCNNITLDVETSWELTKCLNYTKEINWLHIGECFDPPCEWCVLFNLEVPGPGFDFELWPSACVELVDDVDVNPDNNCAHGPPLYLYTVVSGPL